MLRTGNVQAGPDGTTSDVSHEIKFDNEAKKQNKKQFSNWDFCSALKKRTSSIFNNNNQHQFKRAWDSPLKECKWWRPHAAVFHRTLPRLSRGCCSARCLYGDDGTVEWLGPSQKQIAAPLHTD